MVYQVKKTESKEGLAPEVSPDKLGTQTGAAEA
jgi:hypothetical protein